MKQRNNTSPSLQLRETMLSVYSPPVGNNGGAVELPNTVGDNKPVGVKMTLAIFAFATVVALIVATVVYAILRQVGVVHGWSLPWSALAMALALIGFAKFVVSHVTGDYSVVKDSDNRKQVRLREIDSKDEAFAALAEFETLAEEHRHEEEMARIEAANSGSRFVDQMEYLMRTVMRLESGQPNATIVPHRETVYTSANPESDEAYQAIKEYLMRLFTPDGTMYNPEEVRENRTIKNGLPWNNEWSTQSWRQQAKNSLTVGDYSPLVFEGQGWRVREDYNLFDCLKQIERY